MTLKAEGVIHDPAYQVNGSHWATPVQRLWGRVAGDARVIRNFYPQGFYRFEGTFGYELYEVKRRMPVSLLQRKMGGAWRTWMVDDPLHWYAMGELVRQLPAGRILCAGLGLGLMLHHLVRRGDVPAITVVEVDPNVTQLVKPSLPSDPRIEIVHDDWEGFLSKASGRFDGVLWDLAVGSPVATAQDMTRAAFVHDQTLKGVPLLRFGLRDQSVLRFDLDALQKAARIVTEVGR